MPDPPPPPATATATVGRLLPLPCGAAVVTVNALLLGGPLYRSVLAGRLPPSSVHPHARHRHVILRV